MAELYVVRHGQASFNAENYDQLSELGYQQAVWLGEHYQSLDRHFDLIVTGDLARQKQTADSFFEGLGVNNSIAREIIPGLNEYNFRLLYKDYCKQSNQEKQLSQKKPMSQKKPFSQKEFYRTLQKSLALWSQGKLETEHESWQSFRQRVIDSFSELQKRSKKRILVVSSGGPITTFIGSVLGLEPSAVFLLNLQIRNTSISHFFYNDKQFRLSSFNTIPHLEMPSREHGITYS